MYSPWVWEVAYCLWGHDLEFQGHWVQKGRRPFPDNYSKSLRAIDLKLDISIDLVCRKMSIDFGVTTLNFKVTEYKKVADHFQTITQKVWELSIWNSVYRIFSGVSPPLLISPPPLFTNNSDFKLMVKHISLISTHPFFRISDMKFVWAYSRENSVCIH